MTWMLVWVARIPSPPPLSRRERGWDEARFDGFPRPSQTQGVPPTLGKDVTLTWSA